MRILHLGAATIILAMTALPASAQDTDMRLTASTGFDYSSGKYGTPQATDILVGLSDLNLKTGDFLFSAAIPYMNVTGPAYFVIGSNGAPVIVNPKAGAISSTRVGFGDLNFSGTYSLPADLVDGFDVDLSGRVKLATSGTSKGLSTGKPDFGFAVDVSRQFGIWSPFLTAGFVAPGRPKNYSLNNAASASIGTSVQVADDVLVIGSYDYDESISKSLADAHEISVSASWLATDSLTLTAYSEVGLSSGAPAAGGGLLISWALPKF
jgi:hypothetical protein